MVFRVVAIHGRLQGAASALVEEVPGSKRKSEDTKTVGHPCVAARVDLPPTPEGEGGGDDHEDSAKGVHWSFLM